MNIEKAFDSFMSAAYPGGVSALQYEESRRVWYAATHALLCHSLSIRSIEGMKGEMERLLVDTSTFAEQVAEKRS